MTFCLNLHRFNPKRRIHRGLQQVNFWLLTLTSLLFFMFSQPMRWCTSVCLRYGVSCALWPHGHSLRASDKVCVLPHQRLYLSHMQQVLGWRTFHFSISFQSVRADANGSCLPSLEMGACLSCKVRVPLDARRYTEDITAAGHPPSQYMDISNTLLPRPLAHLLCERSGNWIEYQTELTFSWNQRLDSTPQTRKMRQ